MYSKENVCGHCPLPEVRLVPSPVKRTSAEQCANPLGKVLREGSPPGPRRWAAYSELGQNAGTWAQAGAGWATGAGCAVASAPTWDLGGGLSGPSALRDKAGPLPRGAFTMALSSPRCEQRGPGGAAGGPRCARAGWWRCTTTTRGRARPTSTSRYGQPPALRTRPHPVPLSPALLYTTLKPCDPASPPPPPRGRAVKRGRGRSRISKWLAESWGQPTDVLRHSRHVARSPMVVAQ